ncbi:ABC transporter substrate-binding protein [Bosea sp. 685]|uniref:ABC transporter substrate-binding protein n=1 Tax=Bosea sp. 685 TaxID=3080057 RepID=UPI002892F24E|nr:ABC transporter substrate-binding protein [Bosea sp. 685]WNJ93099.1 ABC transporter substrate-binding protein [Bosea sp. 685]
MKLKPCLTALALACAAGVSFQANAQEMKAEVIHWWTSGGESAAVKVFAEQFAKAGGTWVDTAIAGGVNARTAAINRVVGGTPPTAMQFNTGKQFDELVENDLLRDVDQIATEQKWKSVMPQAIIDATSRNGKMYAVPVNIHGQNWLWLSKAALEKAGASEPANWDEALVALEKLKAAGLIPLAFSGQKVWERGLFNAVLVGKGGTALWASIHGKRDPAAARSPEFRAVAETYGKLRGYIDAGAPGRNWNDATNLVIQGKAGMQIMGDWAKGEFAAAGQTAGKEFGCAILSNEGGYVMGGDVFAFPKLKDPAQQKAQLVLAKVMLEPETQIRFAQKKGSIPVRLDLDVSSLDACAQKAVKLLADKKHQVASQEMLSPPALTGAMEDVISQYWNTPAMSADAFMAKVADVLKQPF